MSCILCEHIVEYPKRQYCELGSLDIPESIYRKAKKHKNCPLNYKPKKRYKTAFVPDLYVNEVPFPRFKRGQHD